MNRRMQEWLDAAKILAANPTATVVCPKCGNANLVVTDIPYLADKSRWERHILCPACHTTGRILMRQDPDHGERQGEVAGWGEKRS